MIKNLCGLPKRRWNLLVSGYPIGGRPLLEQVWIVKVFGALFTCFICGCWLGHHVTVYVCTRTCAHIILYVFFPVRGMMYYRQALELQCLLEFAGDDGLWFLNIYTRHYFWNLAFDSIASNGTLYFQKANHRFALQPFWMASVPWNLRQIKKLILIRHKLSLIWSSPMLFLVRCMGLKKNPLNNGTGVVTAIFWI
jgi:hypothetical protein